MTQEEGLFGQALEFPDADIRRRYDELVGLDRVKRRVLAEATVLLDPSRLNQWSKAHHKRILPVVDEVRDRTPLLIFGGDVGTGKTALAESCGDAISRQLGVAVTMYPLSLTARGRGAVGEMTALLTAAFRTVNDAAAVTRDKKGRLSRAIVFVIDEADSLAESRASAQMHHEDRAGVNAVIRGVDQLRLQGRAVLTIMCTNRLGAIDPAIRRRAAGIFSFHRPDDDQRSAILRRLFDGVGISERDFKELVRLTGPMNGRSFGCTYSDLRQRFLPEVVLDVFDHSPIAPSRVLEIARSFAPTQPFGDEESA